MASIIITGATGTAGSAVLSAALASPQIAHVTVLARRPPPITDAKLTTVLLPSDEYPRGFDEFPPSLIEKLRGNEAVVWALGVSQTQVSKEEYIRITHDYTLAAATAFKSLGTRAKPFRFVFVSGQGADQAANEGGWFSALFAQVKGRTERDLIAMESDGFEVANLRPAGIAPTEERRPQVQHWNLVAIDALRRVFPSALIESTTLADAALALATGDKAAWAARDPREKWIDNATLKKIAEAYVQTAPASA